MQPNKRPILIGITGNIGSGKSTLSSYICDKYIVVNADQLAHEVLNSKEVMEKLIRRWGRSILKEKYPDSRMIASIVFKNKDELQFLNSIIHPAVLHAMQKIVEESRDDYLFFEIPLLFEAKLENCFDHVILVRTDQETLIKRISNRDKMDSSEVLLRLRNQMSDSDKIKLADTVIDNKGSISDLKDQAQVLLNKLHSIKYRRTFPFYERNQGD